MECLKYAALLIVLFSLQVHESETSCEIPPSGVSSPPESCNITVIFKIDYSCHIDNQLVSVKVKEKKESDSSKLLCSLTFLEGKCDQQTGCTCSTSQRFSVTRYVTVSHPFEWEITTQLKNGTLISKSMKLHLNCDKPNNDVTDNTLVKDASQTTSVNAASETVCISVAVSLGLGLLIVTSILLVVCCRNDNCKVCAPRSARRRTADVVTFRQVPAREQENRGVVDSDESHHAYIEVIDDSGEPGTSATGRTSSPEAVDHESDGYLHPYTSPTSGTYGHSYSSLATRCTKPDNYLNPIPSTSESTAAARGRDVDSPYEIA